jgi:hypothetical protein
VAEEAFSPHSGQETKRDRKGPESHYLHHWGMPQWPNFLPLGPNSQRLHYLHGLMENTLDTNYTTYASSFVEGSIWTEEGNTALKPKSTHYCIDSGTVYI